MSVLPWSNNPNPLVPDLIIDGSELPRGCWDLNSESLAEQPVFICGAI